MQPSKLLSKSQATNAKNIQTGEKNPDLKLKQWQTFHIVLKNGFLLLELILLEFIHHLLPLSTFFFFYIKCDCKIVISDREKVAREAAANVRS